MQTPIHLMVFEFQAFEAAGSSLPRLEVSQSHGTIGQQPVCGDFAKFVLLGIELEAHVSFDRHFMQYIGSTAT